MKIFLSAIENVSARGTTTPLAKIFVQHGVNLSWVLMSFYYIFKKGAGGEELADFVIDHAQEVMIDSGAHSFQKGVHVDWDAYTQKYAEFIKKHDSPNIVGYFEMDVDNVIGYEKVKQLRKVLEAASDKIIPVWHKNRGLEDFKEMCQSHRGKVVAITGFRNEDIRDEQYLMFLKYARKCGCKVHCLGMTRKKVLDKVPFDYADSSSWVQDSLYGRVKGQHVPRSYTTQERNMVMEMNFIEGKKMQEHYYAKWRKECKD